MIKITSSQNQKIKDIAKLRKTAKRKKSDLFIIEGKKEISLAIKSGIKTLDIFYCPQLLKNSDLLKEITGEKYELDVDTFKKVSLRENPDGVLCLAEPRYLQISDIKAKKNPLLLILESIEKPGNIGAILRTADACNIDYVIICEAKTDIYNHNVIRSSLGTVFTNKIVICKNSDLFPWLKENKIISYAATPDTDIIYTEVDLKGPTAIVIGTEHEGLSSDWLNFADHKIKIPMLGKIDSLNASVSAAVMLFEAIRQRQK